MKTSLTYLSILSFSLLLLSCGGGESSEQSKDTASDQMEDSNASEAKEDDAITGDFALNTEQSELMWEGNMLKIGGVSLYGHNGTVDFAKGQVNLKNGNITGGTLVVNMKTIVATDDNYGEDNPKEKLLGHLSSEDFFAIDKYPDATFNIRGGDESVVKGTMTIRGVTNDEAIENLTMMEQGDQIIIKGTMTVDRQKYNVAFEMPAEDKVLSDDLDFEFKVVLDKQKNA